MDERKIASNPNPQSSAQFIDDTVADDTDLSNDTGPSGDTLPQEGGTALQEEMDGGIKKKINEAYDLIGDLSTLIARLNEEVARLQSKFEEIQTNNDVIGEMADEIDAGQTPEETEQVSESVVPAPEQAIEETEQMPESVATTPEQTPEETTLVAGQSSEYASPLNEQPENNTSAHEQTSEGSSNGEKLVNYTSLDGDVYKNITEEQRRRLQEIDNENHKRY